MKALGRRLGIIAVILISLFAMLLMGRWWSASQDPLAMDRAYLYARAVDQVAAAGATPAMASQFRLILPFDTPAEDRPAGAPPEAFAGTAPAVLPCPLDAAELRRAGPGRCNAASVASYDPAICAFIACVVVQVPTAFLEDRATRKALKAGDLRRRVCAMHGPKDAMGWRRESDGLPECGPLRFAPVATLLAEPVGEHDYRYRLLF